MEITQLHYFRVVAQVENMTTASTILNVTQPTLSTAINRLEQELNAKLFERRGNRLQLSNAGRVFQEGLSQVFLDLDIAIDRTREVTLNDSGKIYVGVSYNGIASTVIRDFIRLHPNIHFFETVQIEQSAFRLLETGALDLLISDYEIPKGRTTSHYLFTEGLMALVSPNNVFSKQSELVIADLLRMKIIYLGQIFGIYAMLPSESNGSIYNKSHINLLYEGTDVATAISLAEADLGVLVMPKSVYSWYENNCPSIFRALIPVPFSQQELHLDVHASVLAGSTMRPAPQMFLDFLRSHYQ